MSNNLVRISTNAAKWTLLLVWSNRVLGLLSTLVLVKFLTPYDFGVAVTAVMVQSLAQSFTDIGYKQYLIKNNLRDATSVSSAWTLSLYFKFTSVLVILLLAFISRYYYNNVDVSDVLVISSLVPILTAFVNPGLVLDEMDDNYKTQSLIPIFTKIITVPITILLAVFYQSFWAVVISGLISSILGVVLSYLMHTYRPRFTHVNFKPQLLFAKKIFFYSMLGFLRSRSENFFILYLFGVKGNGTYSVTQEFGYLPLTEIAMPLSRGFFATAASLKTNEERVQLLSKYLNIGFLILIPCAFGSLAIADLFAEVVMGPQWVPYASLITLFSVISVQFFVINLISNLFVINDRFRFIYLIDILYITSLAVSTYLVGFSDLQYFTAARAVIAYFILAFGMTILSRIIGVNLLRSLKSLPVICICSLLMFLLVETLSQLFDTNNIHSLISFFSLVFFGACLYLVLIFVASKVLSRKIEQMNDIQQIYILGYKKARLLLIKR